MPKLFGVDIAKEVAKGFSGQLVIGTLTKLNPGTRTAGSLTAGTNSTETAHTFEGITEFKQIRRAGQLGDDTVATVLVLAASVKPAAEPEANDKIAIESFAFTIDEILERDPAAATFLCQVS